MTELAKVDQQEREAVCEKHGKYTAKVTVILGREIVHGCPECEEEAQASSDEQRKREAQAEAELAIRSALPKRFAGSTFDGFVAKTDGQRRALAICKKYATRWDDRKQNGGCLVMCGKPGTGKTHLASAIAREVITAESVDSAGRGGIYNPRSTVRYITASALARAVKSTYGSGAQETEAQVMTKFSRVPLLVIDEVGAQRGTETELLLLQEIIDNRYQNVLPTILISNLPESELAKYIGERALDRMYDNGGAVIAFDWESHRRAGK